MYVDQGVALIRSQNVYDNHFEWSGIAHITDDAAEKLRGVTVGPGDILFNITGDSILRTCLVDPAVLPARVNQHVAIIRAAPGIPSQFLHLALVRQEMKDHLLGFDAGGTRQAITKGHLEAITLLAPPREILLAFSRATDPLCRMTESLRAESRELVRLRDSLLPKLLSGEVGLTRAEKLASRA